MSLEKAVQDNTAAIRDLIHALGSQRVLPTGGTIADLVDKEAGLLAVKDNDGNIHRGVHAPEHDQKPLGKPAAAPAEKPADTQPTAAEPAAPTPKAEPSEPKVIDFAKDIQQPIIKLAATGHRDLAVSILGQFGAARASDIKPEDYAAAAAVVAKAVAP